MESMASGDLAGRLRLALGGGPRREGRSMNTSMRRLLLSVVIASAVSACSDSSNESSGDTSGDVTKLEHIVLLMQENRSYDHYFGLLHERGQPDSEPLSNKGNPNPLDPADTIEHFPQPRYCETDDLEHSWNDTHAEINGGAMDKFTAVNATDKDPSGSRAMGLYDDQRLPFYYWLANTFAVADQFFSSVPGPTFPNRFYYLTGTSFGHIRNDLAVYDQKTIFELLEEAGVSWKIYMVTGQVEIFFRYVQEHAEGHVFPIAQYYEDAKNGALPQVVYLESNPLGDANTESDEHPPANEQVGQRFTHDVLEALVQSPNWPNSAFILTYDEHGGYYDHVPPPAAIPPDDIPPMLEPGDAPGAFDRLGVRVPAVVVSPWAKPHYVSHTIYDHTSVLKLIETRFGLAALTRRDANANDMLDMFDFSRRSTPNPVVPPAPVDLAGLEECAGAETSGEL